MQSLKLDELVDQTRDRLNDLSISIDAGDEKLAQLNHGTDDVVRQLQTLQPALRTFLAQLRSSLNELSIQIDAINVNMHESLQHLSGALDTAAQTVQETAGLTSQKWQSCQQAANATGSTIQEATEQLAQNVEHLEQIAESIDNGCKETSHASEQSANLHAHVASRINESVQQHESIWSAELENAIQQVQGAWKECSQELTESVSNAQSQSKSLVRGLVSMSENINSAITDALEGEFVRQLKSDGDSLEQAFERFDNVAEGEIGEWTNQSGSLEEQLKEITQIVKPIEPVVHQVKTLM